jgi:hypothetical protein
MPPYEFQPLPSDGGAIRLLELCPGKLSDPIRLSISHKPFSNENFPKYEALSYVWGSQENPITVEVVASQQAFQKRSKFLRGLLRYLKYASTTAAIKYYAWATLDIGQNLAEALVHLRLKKERRVLWVDATCINQRDLAERSKEVRKMGDIYRLAACVLVWLGPASADSSLAMQTISYLGSQVDVDFNANTSYAAADAEEDGWYLSGVALPYPRTTWNAIASLLDRDWFKRVWIWQEILLANTSARVICGIEEILWSNIRAAIWILFLKKVTPFNEDSIAKDNLLRAFGLARTSKKSDFLLLLSRGRLSFCAVPRDRIYALLAIANDTSSIAIQPDYTKDVNDVYLDLILRWLQEFSSLAFLLQCNYQPLATGPTWVPNWSKPKITITYTRSNSSPLEGPFKYLGQGHLKVKARFCGIVVHCGKAAPPILSREEMLLTVRSWEPEDLLTADYPSGGKLLDAFLSTLVDDRFCARTAIPENPTLTQAKNEYLQVRRSGLVATVAASPSIQNLYYSLVNYVSGRTLLTTDNSHIALGPSQARPGDYIVVILGCSNPMVLRSTIPGYYEVIGDCNLHGFRDFQGLLGPLPDGWYVEDNPQQAEVDIRFVDSKTGQKSREDPRLPGIPPGYKVVIKNDGVRWFHHSETGKWYSEDPRLWDVEFLRARGVDIKDIVLV